MKNHIVFKFIAVLLCAASLLGAVGSGLGVFALTEMDLYDKTVDQVYQERVKSEGQNFTHNIALWYASENLGGCSVPMLENVYRIADGYYNGGFEPFYYGYALKDAEGNVLDSRELTYTEGVTTYSFPVSGQYMHLVEVVPQNQPVAAEPYIGVGDDPVIYDAVPADGAVVGQLEIWLDDGSVHSYGEDNLGTVFYNQDGILIFRCSPRAVDMSAPKETITEIYLWNSYGDLLYQAESPDGVGTIRYAEDGSSDLIFTSYYTHPTAAYAEEPVAETTLPEAAAPMTTAAAEETVPAVTAEPETIPQETATETPEDSAEAAEEPEEKEPADEGSDSESEEKSEDPENAEAETKKEAEPASEEAAAEDSGDAETSEDSENSEAAGEVSGEDSDAAEPAAYSEDSEAEPDTDSAEVTEDPADVAATEAMPTEAPADAAAAETIPAETAAEETVPAETEPVLINGKTLDSYQINRTEYYDSTAGGNVTAKYVYVPMPEMTLELYVAPGALDYESIYTVLRVVRSLRDYLFPAMGICLLLFAVCVVYLCCAAGRKPKSDEIAAGGLNRMPLDLYGFLTVMGVGFLCVAIAEGGDYLLRQNVTVGCAFAIAMAYLACLLLVGFGFAFVAQIKMPGGFWWRNSLCGWGIRLVVFLWNQLIRFAIWLEEKLEARGFPLLKRLFKWIWGLISASFLWLWHTVQKICRWLGEKFNRFFSLLPLTWQWILAGIAMVFFLFVALLGRSLFGVWLAILFAFCLVLYGAHCFGVLLESTKKMNKGDLDNKVDDKLMIGAFKDFAHDLNDLAGVAVVAAQKQLKSERMKTELITNVSHDIKTPLTSIINYVDLLQKPHTDEEQAQYLEVLDRQSQRLKKLIDDLMDMSKASTGNMAVDITLVDAVESVNQALGEFADKLDKAQLTPVFRHTEESVAMMADGRLVWRVLSNLLSNAVKYALPGTRLYIDLMSLEGKVVISLKNISRDELNVDAEELMERFVRGDDSRNTEGSGLGLNIAKSLMELQKGQLQLLVDGDLFKITLIFPGI